MSTVADLLYAALVYKTWGMEDRPIGRAKADQAFRILNDYLTAEEAAACEQAREARDTEAFEAAMRGVIARLGLTRKE